MKWTRRKFLSSTAGGPVLLGASSALVTVITPARAAAVVPLDTKSLKTLQAAMAEIIPAVDKMPSACDAGGMKYLVSLMGQEPGIAREIQAAVTALDAASQKEAKASFEQLGHEQRIAVLSALEAEDKLHFATLRDYVYESYYTQPQVWKLIGYDFHATDHTGPHMAPFDESVLAHVRNKPKFYREA